MKKKLITARSHVRALYLEIFFRTKLAIDCTRIKWNFISSVSFFVGFLEIAVCSMKYTKSFFFPKTFYFFSYNLI